MTNKPTKPYDWNRFVKHGAKVLNEEAGVKTPAEAKKQTKPYYVSINGNLTDVNNPEWVKRAANFTESTKQTATGEFSRNPYAYKYPKAPPAKITNTKIGQVKHLGNTKDNLHIDEDSKRYVMKKEYEAKKFNKPMSGANAIVREIIKDDAIDKLKALKTKPVQIDYSIGRELSALEEFNRSRIEADARARRYHEIIKKKQDPNLHSGLAAVLGSIPSDFEK